MTTWLSFMTWAAIGGCSRNVGKLLGRMQAHVGLRYFTRTYDDRIEQIDRWFNTKGR